MSFYDFVGVCVGEFRHIFYTSAITRGVGGRLHEQVLKICHLQGQPIKS